MRYITFLILAVILQFANIEQTQAIIDFAAPVFPNGNTCDGQLTVIAQADPGKNSAGPFTYDWAHDPGLNGATATDLCAQTYTVIVTNSYGCSKTLTIDLAGNNSLSQSNANLPESGNELVRTIDENNIISNIFPNPFNNTIQVELQLANPVPVEINLVDGLGRKLQEQRIDAGQNFTGNVNTVFQTSGLSEGLYFIHITVDQQTTIVKRVFKSKR